MIGIINNKFVFALSELTYATNHIVVDKKTLAKYSQNTKEKEKGMNKEKRALLLVRMLDGVKDAWLALPGSAADCQLKLDLMIEYTDGEAAGIQIKSSLHGAEEHIAKELVVYKDRAYPVPGVLYFDDTENNLSILKGLAQIFGLRIRKDIREAVSLIKGAKWNGQVIPLMVVERLLSRKQLEDLGTLGLLIKVGREVKFR